MNTTLLRAVLAFVPICMLVVGAILLFSIRRTVWSLLQLLGAACLIVVALTHVFEALQLFPWMRWGVPHSVGHYIDLSSAFLGVTLFPVGYLFHALATRR